MPPLASRRDALVGALALASSRAARDGTPRVTRAVVRAPSGIDPERAAREWSALSEGFLVDGTLVRDGSGTFTLEFRDADGPGRGGGVALAGVVIGSSNPARARNAAVRRGAKSASGGDNCRGDTYAGCAATTSETNARARYVGSSWAEGSVVRVVVSASDVDALATRVQAALGPEARRTSGELVVRGVSEFAAEDARTKSASTFLSFPTKYSTAIEIVPGSSASGYVVQAFHLELPEGCGVVYL